MHPIIIKPTDKLSEHFTIQEAIMSQTGASKGIDNSPDIDALVTMVGTAAMMERIRSILNKPIKINSWYRSPSLNAAVGGTPTSQHSRGEAVDFVCPGFGNPLEICRAIITNQNIILFDQMILEHTWVHISFAIQSGKPRGQVISLLNNGRYAAGLTNSSGKPY